MPQNYAASVQGAAIRVTRLNAFRQGLEEGVQCVIDEALRNARLKER